ncbi:MAG: peptide-methionine (S)-S-oxide reductase MsrA [Bdellovibrionales bacterium]|nr:peptide-methionine (S)-S-oxide reductase MsrA [Bdellovibrionales bacterium]
MKNSSLFLKVHPMNKATLAGGCFWGVEELFRTLPGVIKTTVGYTGGQTLNPTYETVKTGTTGHAEAIQIEFHPEKISYDDILEFFFRIHDPTTFHRQGNDIGSQYRSEIFCHSQDQKIAAQKAIQQATESGRWQKPIVTKVSDFHEFHSAESYHQEYLKKNPGGYTCHFIRD